MSKGGLRVVGHDARYEVVIINSNLFIAHRACCLLFHRLCLQFENLDVSTVGIIVEGLVNAGTYSIAATYNGYQVIKISRHLNNALLI